MKWFVVTVLLASLLSYGGGSAIRCTPGGDATCPSESGKEVPPAPVISPVNQEVADQQRTTQQPAVYQAECLAGTEWFSHCHYCRCSDSGIAECLREETCDDGVFVPPMSVVSPVKQEVAGKKKNGQQLPAQELLVPQLVSQESSAQQLTTQQPAVQQVECLAGTEWFSNCHYCRCSDSGIAECLREETCDDGVFEEPMQCKPNTTFIRDCNTCVCLENGLALCTLEFCRRSGTDVPPVPKKTKLPIGVECAPGTSWKNQCAECRCSDSGYRQCNPIECEEKEKVSDTEFDKQFKTFNDDKQFSAMNMTTLARRVRATPQEAPKACQPGQEFRLDCNKCLCDNEGQDFSCTRIDCNALNSNNNGGGRSKRGASDLDKISTECSPGSVFEKDCNTCRCTTDGHHAMCTNKRCTPEVKQNTDNDIHSTEADPGFRCDPGEQFKKDCKDCTCSADGKGYFCTLHLCDEFIAPGI